jgi:Virulence-associated protein E
VELSELDGMARREVNHVKRFLTTPTDNVTLKYQAFASDHARRCVFIGTTNEHNPLRDATGNRRFLPVRISERIDIEWVRENIEQLIGEAATLEAAGELFLIPDDVIAEAQERQEEAREEADFEIHLNAWFGNKVAASYILPTDLAMLLKEATGRSVPSNQYGTHMRKPGFLQSTPRIAGATTRMWCRDGIEGAQRYIVHRGMDGRLLPKLNPAVPLTPGVVLPMTRPPGPDTQDSKP